MRMAGSERDLQYKLGQYLETWFNVEYEVWSTDNKKRIDIVIVNRQFKENIYPIGIEVKVDDKKTGKDLAIWLKQSSIYATKEFKGYGKCLIVTYPQVSGAYLKEGDKMHNHEFKEGCSPDHNVATFLSMFGVGELQRYKRVFRKIGKEVTHLRIVYKGQIIWDMYKDNFRINNYDRLCR
jgi:hypothetical protein